MIMITAMVDVILLVLVMALDSRITVMTRVSNSLNHLQHLEWYNSPVIPFPCCEDECLGEAAEKCEQPATANHSLGRRNIFRGGSGWEIVSRATFSWEEQGWETFSGNIFWGGERLRNIFWRGARLRNIFQGVVLLPRKCSSTLFLRREWFSPENVDPKIFLNLILRKIFWGGSCWETFSGATFSGEEQGWETFSGEDQVDGSTFSGANHSLGMRRAKNIFQGGSGWETFPSAPKWGMAELIHTTFGCLQSLLFTLVSNYS